MTTIADRARLIIQPNFDDELKVDEKAPGWVSDGHWAALTNDTFGLPTRQIETMAKLIADGEGGPKTPLVERIDLRVESVYRNETERDCEGCDCGECPGTEPRSVRIMCVQGRMVFTGGAGGLMEIDPGYGRLLTGLDVFALGPGLPASKADYADWRKVPPVGGFENGRLVVIVMPRRLSDDLWSVTP